MDLDAIQWYEKKYVLHNLVEELRYREFCLIDKEGLVVRDCVGWQLRYLADVFKAYKFFAENRNMMLYGSMCILYKTPMASFNPAKRKEDKLRIDALWRKPDGCDFTIDVDNKNLSIAKKETKAIIDLYDTYKLPYYVKFSGSKGYHVSIDYSNMPLGDNKVETCKKLASAVANITNSKSMDMTVYDNRRVFKLAYSLDLKGKKPLVVLPLSADQLESCEKKDFEIKSVLDNNKIFQRGLLTRNGDAANVRVFMDEVLKDGKKK